MLIGRWLKFPVAHLRGWVQRVCARLSNKRSIRGRGNVISHDGAVLRNVDFDMQGDRNQIIIGRGSFLQGVRFFVRGSDHRVVIGENCHFSQGGTIWFEDSECLLQIGDKTTVEEANIALTEPGSSVSVGKDCMLAYDVDIRCGDSHSIIDVQSGKRINYAADIVIGDHVWIGAHAQVLKGVHIGPNSIVAIRGVVTEDVPPNSIAAGIPAKIIKTGVTWDRRRIYDDR